MTSNEDQHQLQSARLMPRIEPFKLSKFSILIIVINCAKKKNENFWFLVRAPNTSNSNNFAGLPDLGSSKFNNASQIRSQIERVRLLNSKFSTPEGLPRSSRFPNPRKNFIFLIISGEKLKPRGHVDKQRIFTWN